MKRRKVSSYRDFPRACGRLVLQINHNASETIIDVGPVKIMEFKMDAQVKLDCVKLLGNSSEPGTLGVGKRSVIGSPYSPKVLISETTKLINSLDKVEAIVGVKTAENPEGFSEIEIGNPSKLSESESLNLSKVETLDSLKSFDERLSTGLLEKASPEKDLPPAVQFPIDRTSSDIPEQLKFSNHSQTAPVVEAVIRSSHKKYPQRRISAIRDFPLGCGRKPPHSKREECKKSVVSFRDRSLVSVKKEIVQCDTKEMRAKIWDADAQKSKLEGVIAKDFKVKFQVNSEKGVKKETVEGYLVKLTSDSKWKGEHIKQNNTRPLQVSNTFRTDLKPSSSSKTVDRKFVSSGGKLGQDTVKPNKDKSLNQKFPGQPVYECHAACQGEEYADIEPFDERASVQGLLAEPNCPWRQEKHNFRSPSSMTHTTAGIKAKNKELMVQDNTKSIFKKKKNIAEKPKRKNKDRTMFRTQLNLKDVDDFPGDEEEDKNCSLVNKSQGSAHSLISHGLHSMACKDVGNEAVVTRKKVRETLRMFQAIFRKLMQEAEAKLKEGQALGLRRFDLISGNMLRDNHRWVNTGKPILGPVPGVEVGDEFHYRVELAIVGLHRPFQSGIDYLNGKKLATSIVASGGYDDDMETSDVLKYSGQGGNPTGSSKKAEDQKLVRGNLALKNSMDQKTLVRVIHGFKSSDSVDARSKVSTTYTYDGLYLVERYWQEKGRYGTNVFMFELRRIPGQPELAMKEVKKSRKAKIREGLCVADISQGKEKKPICAVNTIDNEKPPPFTYVTNMIYPSWYNKTPAKGCNCTDGCSDSEKCLCAFKNGGDIPFNFDGAIVQAKRLVYECGPSCKCPPSCYNRVSQHGIKFQLEIFKTKLRGWGVRSLTSIPSGSFICEYTGELLQDKEAEERICNDEYLFDIGTNYNDPFLEGLSAVIPSDLKTNSSCESVEDGGFTIDAALYGSIGRFINHSCSPNCYAQNVLYDHDDKRMPHIMLFAAENIPPLQELTYHYNYQIDQVHDSDGNIKKKNCYCGSVDCTGRMY